MAGLSERHPLLRNQTYLSYYSWLLSLSLSLPLLSKCRLSPVYAPQGCSAHGMNRTCHRTADMFLFTGSSFSLTLFLDVENHLPLTLLGNYSHGWHWHCHYLARCEQKVGFKYLLSAFKHNLIVRSTKSFGTLNFRRFTPLFQGNLNVQNA
jgi:hypothetical protein